MVIDNKSLDVVCEGKKANKIRVSEKERDFRVSITFLEDEVQWLLGVLQEFYWTKDGKAWAEIGSKE